MPIHQIPYIVECECRRLVVYGVRIYVHTSFRPDHQQSTYFGNVSALEISFVLIFFFSSFTSAFYPLRSEPKETRENCEETIKYHLVFRMKEKSNTIRTIFNWNEHKKSHTMTFSVLTERERERKMLNLYWIRWINCNKPGTLFVFVSLLSSAPSEQF